MHTLFTPVHSGSESDAAPEAGRRPRRQWTIRLAEQLGIAVRRIQEWRHDPTFPDPDRADDAAAADWIAWERLVRSWLQWRQPMTARRHCRPAGPEILPIPPWAGAAAVPAAPTLTGVPKPAPGAALSEHQAWADAEARMATAAKARIELDRAAGVLIPRDQVGAFVVEAKAAGSAALDELLAALRSLIPSDVAAARRSDINGALARAQATLTGRLSAAYRLHLEPKETP